MTLSEARKTLGLGPDDDPRPFLNEFKEARERIAEMVRTAPNETLEVRYQKGLTDFDQALAAVREYLEALGLIPKSAPAPEPVVAIEPAPEPAPEAFPTPEIAPPAAEIVPAPPVEISPPPAEIPAPIAETAAPDPPDDPPAVRSRT